MIFNTPRRLLITAAVFIGSILATFFFAMGHMALENKIALADLRNELILEHQERAEKARRYHQGELTKWKNRTASLEATVERLRGELNLCAKGGGQECCRQPALNSSPRENLGKTKGESS